MKALLQDVPRELRHNVLVYYWDIAVWGLYTGSTVVFLGVYAAREGATSAQIGWLSAGPAIVALLLSVPAGLLARRIKPKSSVVVSALIARILLLAYVFIPAVLPQPDRVNALIVLTVVMAIPNTILNICFAPLMLLAIPPEWRGQVVATRNALMSVISFVVTLACGQLLTLIASPLGYQIVFFVGFVGAVATAYVLGQVKVLQPVSQQIAQTKERWTPRQLLPRHDPAGRHYIVVLMMLFSLNITGYMGAPLIPKLTVNTLGLSDAVISVGSALASILVFGVSLFVAQLARKHGNKRLTAVGAGMLFLQSFALAFAQDAGLFLLASVVAGCASGILGAASFNYHLDNLPQLDQTAWISWSSMLGNVAVLVGSVAGPAIAVSIGVPATFVGLGVLRLLIGVMIHVLG